MNKRKTSLNSENQAMETVKRDLNRRKKMRKKRKRRIIILRVFFLVMLMSMLMFLYFIDHNPISRTQYIIIKGHEYTNESDILKQAKIQKGDRFYLKSKKKIRNKIEALDLVDSVNVEKDLKNRIWYISVRENEAMVFDEESNFLYFENGNSMMISNERYPYDVPLIRNFNDDLTRKLITKLSEVEAGTRQSISEIILSPEKYNEEALKLIMNNEYYVFVNIDTLPLLNNYATIISRAEPENRCIYLLEYGPNDNTHVASAKPCED